MLKMPLMKVADAEMKAVTKFLRQLQLANNDIPTCRHVDIPTLTQHIRSRSDSIWNAVSLKLKDSFLGGFLILNMNLRLGFNESLFLGIFKGLNV